MPDRYAPWDGRIHRMCLEVARAIIESGETEPHIALSRRNTQLLAEHLGLDIRDHEALLIEWRNALCGLLAVPAAATGTAAHRAVADTGSRLFLPVPMIERVIRAVQQRRPQLLSGDPQPPPLPGRLLYSEVAAAPIMHRITLPAGSSVSTAEIAEISAAGIPLRSDAAGEALYVSCPQNLPIGGGIAYLFPLSGEAFTVLVGWQEPEAPIAWQPPPDTPILMPPGVAVHTARPPANPMAPDSPTQRPRGPRPPVPQPRTRD
ncbi:MAG TPA: hypothetical protein VKT77_10195 [Chthonomonadaceae bacterium]|nr:hypothetical protein [Chthonomonadaceae bacterium]